MVEPTPERPSRARLGRRRVLAGLLLVLAIAILWPRTKPPPEPISPTLTRRVIFTRRDFPAGTVFANVHTILALVDSPARILPQHALPEMACVSGPRELMGMIALDRFLKGEPIARVRLARPDELIPGVCAGGPRERLR